MNLHLHYVFWTTAHRHTWTRIWDIPYSFGTDIFGEHIWSSHLLHGKFLELFDSPRTHFLKPTPWRHSLILTLYSLVTTLWLAEGPFISLPFFEGAILLGSCQKGRAQGIVITFFPYVHFSTVFLT